MGRGRSGTTLLRAIFDSHPQMAVPPESHFILPLARRLSRAGGFTVEGFVRGLFRREDFGAWELSDEQIRAALDEDRPRSYADALRSLYRLYARLHNKSRYGDKTPSYLLEMPEIAGLFLEARFVHVVRDGRDVFLSRKDAGFKPDTAEGNAVVWKQFVTRGRLDGLAIGSFRYREIRYEDLIRDPETQVRSLCSFLELEFDPRMLEYYARAESLVGAQPHHANIYRPFKDDLRDWRVEMTAREVVGFELIAGETLEQFGYERSGETASFQDRIMVGLRRLNFGLGAVAKRARPALSRVRRRVRGSGTIA
ncbi:MAG: sulfotransferase family protein [Acidimicrobiia bacterium]